MKVLMAAVVALMLMVPGLWVSPHAQAQTASAKEVRIQKADILKHPIGEVALNYADAIHRGSMDDALKLSSGKAQATWKAYSKSEKDEDTRFRKKIIPNRAALLAGIESGGLLIIENGKTATLNVITASSAPASPGTVQSSTSTIALPFVLEGTLWKVTK